MRRTAGPLRGPGLLEEAASLLRRPGLPDKAVLRGRLAGPSRDPAPRRGAAAGLEARDAPPRLVSLARGRDPHPGTHHHHPPPYLPTTGTYPTYPPTTAP